MQRHPLDVFRTFLGNLYCTGISRIKRLTLDNDMRTLLRSYHRRGWASAVEPSRRARSLPTGPSFSRASWSPAIEVSWRSLWCSSAPSHMHEFAFRTNESAVSPSFSPKLPSRICGVNLRMEKQMQSGRGGSTWPARRTRAISSNVLQTACISLI